MPDTIQFRNGNQILNYYDAAGQKIFTNYKTLFYNIAVPISEGEIASLPSDVNLVDQTIHHYASNIRYLYHVRDHYAETLDKVYNTEGYAHYANDSYRHYYYRKDHLGNNREVWSVANDSIVQRTQYYPSGLPWAEGLNPGYQNHKYNGKEFIEMHGYDVTDLGQRGLYHAINRFTSIDRFAEKYPWQSPYVFAGNNPVNNVDVNGDSIWYTRKDNAITMHVTAKIINRSSRNINMSRAAKSISEGIDNSFSGNFEIDGKTYTMKTDVQLDVASEMEDVADSDHLYVLSDKFEYGQAHARGATNMLGGKVMNIWAGDYANDNWFSNTFSWNNTRTAVHEFGHAAGLSHPTVNISNLMVQGNSSKKITSQQRIWMLNNRFSINKGSNSYGNKPYPYYHYYEGMREIIVPLKTIGLMHQNR